MPTDSWKFPRAKCWVCLASKLIKVHWTELKSLYHTTVLEVFIKSITIMETVKGRQNILPRHSSIFFGIMMVFNWFSFKEFSIIGFDNSFWILFSYNGIVNAVFIIADTEAPRLKRLMQGSLLSRLWKRVYYLSVNTHPKLSWTNFKDKVYI